MGANLVTCSLCCNPYDQSLHLPKVLGCSHTFCLACLLQTFQSYGSISCLNCNAREIRTPAELATNPTIIGLLELTSLKCAVHSTPATFFCCAHYVPVCDQCSHPDCEQAGTLEYTRITATVLSRIDTLWSQIESSGVPVASDLLSAVQKKYENKQQENVDLLQKLTDCLESSRQLSCMNCGGRGELVFNRRTLEVHCSQCVRDSSEAVNVSDPTIARSVLEDSIRGILVYANFCDLSLEILQSFAVRSNLSPIEMLRLAYSLKNSILPKKEVQDLPNYCLCPQCMRCLNMTSDTIRLLPCKEALHAICENCAMSLIGNDEVKCPLDGFTFLGSVRNFQWFQLSQAQVDMPVEPGFALPVSAIQKALIEPEKHAEYPGTDLPAFALNPGQYLLDRFPSVLPAIDMPESRYTSTNRGWNIQPDKNQVEAVTFVVCETIKLTGVGIANPIKPDITATLTFVKIYVGNTARGAPAIVETPNFPLSGGNNVLSYYIFKTPFTISSHTKYTIKLKIVPPQGFLEPMMIYRGNAYEKPEIWIGSDNTVWEFEDTQNVEEGELITGTNILTGPILRFLYTY